MMRLGIRCTSHVSPDPVRSRRGHGQSLPFREQLFTIGPCSTRHLSMAPLISRPPGCVDEGRQYEDGETWLRDNDCTYRYSCDFGQVSKTELQCQPRPSPGCEAVAIPGLCCPLYDCSGVTSTTSTPTPTPTTTTTEPTAGR